MKFDKKDIVVLTGGAVILLFLGSLMYLRFNRTESVTRKKIVGKITFRYRESQRKYSTSVLWKDVNQNDPVYNMDSLRTDNLSEAIIHLDRLAEIELDPDSMIVLEINDETSLIEILKGSIVLKNASPLLKIKADDTLIDGMQGVTRINRLGKTISVYSEKDLAYTIDGKTAHAKGNLITVRNRNAEIAAGSAVHLTQPDDNQRFFTKNSGQTVTFKWTSPVPSVIEIAGDIDFKNIVLKTRTAGNEFSTLMNEGIYYWRINQSAVRKFRIIKLPEIGIFSPPDGKQFANGTNLFFNWEMNHLSEKFNVIIATDPGLINKVKILEVFKNIAVTDLPDGSYYWKITTEGILSGSKNESQVSSFSVGDSAKKEEPGANTQPQGKTAATVDKLVLLSPRYGAVIDMSKNNSILFRWQGKPGTNGFTFRLYSKNGKPVHSAKTGENSLRFTDLEKLDTGRFLWEIENDNSKIKGEFSITLSQELETPELNP